MNALTVDHLLTRLDRFECENRRSSGPHGAGPASGGRPDLDGCSDGSGANRSLRSAWATRRLAHPAVVDPLREKGTQVEGRHDLGVPELRCRARRSESQRDGKRFQATQRRRFAPLQRRRRLLEARGAPDQRADRDLPFEPGQGCAQAEMNADPERHVPVVMPADVETVGIDKLRGIAVGGADRRHDHGALSDGVAIELDVSARDARGALDGLS